MIGLSYLAALLVSLAGMLTIDARYRLFFWRDAISAWIVTAVGTTFYLLWDFAAIHLGIFHRGESRFATGIVLAPEMPLEEPLFLGFLVVCTMVTYNGIDRIVRKAAGARAEP